MPLFADMPEENIIVRKVDIEIVVVSKKLFLGDFSVGDGEERKESVLYFFFRVLSSVKELKGVGIEV